MSNLAVLALVLLAVVVVGLLCAVARLRRRPPDTRWQGRVREDMWGDNKPL